MITAESTSRPCRAAMIWGSILASLRENSMDKFKAWMAANPVGGVVVVAFATALLTSVVLGGMRGPGPVGPPGAVGAAGPA
ncbi:MAG: hypothetical protein H7X89_10775, partial [Rhizobiales bacterium]|nr:hypothetical protein [Hyphomicrobiales bacterium]